MPDLKDVLKIVRNFGFTIILSAIMPWFEALVKTGLISEAFQPGAKYCATLLGCVAFLSTFAYLRPKYKTDEAWIRRFLKYFFLGVVANFVVCLILKFAAGTLLVFNRTGTIVLWVVWFASYVAMFLCLSALLCASAILALPDTPSRKRSIPFWAFAIAVFVGLFLAGVLIYTLLTR